MRVLITGAAGFLGAECARQFGAAAHRVTTTDRSGTVDLRGDLADPAFTASLPDVDVLVHCAAVHHVTKGVPLLRREAFFERNNVQATRNLVERYRARPVHFIHVGTSMMYRQTRDGVYGIHSPMRGEGVYSRSKLAAQAAVDSLAGAATVIPCIIGGEGREGLFRGFVGMIAKRGVVMFPGKGAHPVAMVHVADAAGLIRRIAETGARGRFNAAAAQPLTIRQWIDEIASELGVPNVRKIGLPLWPIKWLAALSGYRLLAREQLLMLELPHVLSIDESLATGWRPQYSNAQIVRAIALHVLRHSDARADFSRSG